MFSQKFYYIEEISSVPHNPTIIDSIKIKVSGTLSDASFIAVAYSILVFVLFFGVIIKYKY